MRKLILLLVLGLLIIPVEVFAGTYGTLVGRVIDKDKKEPLAYASVRVIGTTCGAKTDKEGRFTVTAIPAGEYEVEVTFSGYAARRIKVIIETDVRRDVKDIEISEKPIMAEETIVYGDNLVEASSQGSVNKISANQLKTSAREGVNGVIAMTAGVSTTGSGFSIRGARPSETQVRVNGLDVGNQFSGGYGSTGSGYFPMVSSNATQEVLVHTGGLEAEYGDAMGGVVNTIINPGRTDRYEGFLRFRTEFTPLWGNQEMGVQLISDGQKLSAIRGGEGAKTLGAGMNKYEFGVGGPISFLGNSTFYVTGNYMHEDHRGGGYDINDAWGNSLSLLPHEQSWVKYIYGSIKLALVKDFDVSLGVSLGQSCFEYSSTDWMYANSYGLNADGTYNNIPEWQAKLPVQNVDVSSIFMRIKHQLNEKSFYELTLSNTSNNDMYSKAASYGDPDLFSGFDLVLPEDTYQLNAVGDSLIHVPDGKGNYLGDRVIDQFELTTNIGKTADGYLTIDKPVVSNLTGYIEGSANDGTTQNPYGLQNFYYLHGNATSFEFRKGNYWQLDGNYNLEIAESGDNKKDKFSHHFKTGFELRYYTVKRHSNQMPWDGNPFFDIYTDEWGGNLYTTEEIVKERTNKPYHPYRGSVYFQDQIGYNQIIITPGVRFDYFNANAIYRTDNSTFVPINSVEGFADTKAKFYVSPRLNIAYPLTAESKLSIAYGVYYKMPEIQNLYDGFAVELLRGNSLLGNPNMDVQRVNEYQIAMEQAFNDTYGLVVTAYYRDTYNQLGTSYVPAVPTPYYEYTVSEFGNSRGIEISFRKRQSSINDILSFDINYNLSKAVGTASEPSSNYGRAVDPYSGRMTFPMTEIPLAWDRTHKVNAQVNLTWGEEQGPSIAGVKPLENFNLNLTGFFQTGAPYTPLYRDGKAKAEINSARGPNTWRIDMRLIKSFPLKDWFGEGAGNSSIEFFVDVYNVLNIRRVVGFYTRTGDPLDDGVTFERTKSVFSSISFYKEANYAMPQTYSSDQYDYYGNRLYSEDCDFDKNGIVTQDEKFQSYMNYVATTIQFQSNYQTPRTVYFGLMFRF